MPSTPKEWKSRRVVELACVRSASRSAETAASFEAVLSSRSSKTVASARSFALMASEEDFICEAMIDSSSCSAAESSGASPGLRRARESSSKTSSSSAAPEAVGCSAASTASASASAASSRGARQTHILGRLPAWPEANTSSFGWRASAVTASPLVAWPWKNVCRFLAGSCNTTSAAAGKTSAQPSVVHRALRPPAWPLRAGSPA
mmetsp:Transcript_34517/g.120445  ORF Transcript_34517/g.120445 Transcript_34517/m.120445 type:complete len:205 (-) Transcript_34517:51-665(-)